MFARSVVAALVALPYFAHFTLAQTCARSYTVQEGDDCNSISAAHNSSTYQLATVNSGTVNSDCSNLVPGESLCLGWVGSDCSNTYVVDLGDDCDTIASTFNINTTLLYENNPNIDSSCDNIYVGEVLCVANDVDVPVAGSASSAPVSTVPASTPVSSTPASTPASSIPTSTPSTASSAPAPTSTATDGSEDDGDDDDDDDGDDSDLPFCDEL
ncbi:uncharacterized protein FIBRA_07908 [Fibroporia radiculosa]|uniref:LysM domain-containing protein n=1 Tax=Fibroporia radiculosa TaxID=599839 RepID=J4I1M8_9APHY|nr:uncharacterized protein FIBRA_07908 [Fibroporia radiculosa]CCM05677.1 predicted protein [Fibroporia radiculosa]